MGLERLDIIENIKPDIKKIMIGRGGNSINLLEARLKKQLKPKKLASDIIWEVLLEIYSAGSYCLDDNRDRDNFLVEVHCQLKYLNRLDLFHLFVEAVADEMSHSICFDDYDDTKLFRDIVINKYNDFINKK